MTTTLEKWPSDGHDHKNIRPEDIFLNGSINSFLNDNRISLIIAGKGMGKTLLMRVKRQLLRVDETSPSEPLLVIPSGRTLIDEPQIHVSLSRTGFTEMMLWKGLWSISIVLSIISHLSAKKAIRNTDFLLDEIEKFSIDDEFKLSFMESLNKDEANLPSSYIATLLKTYTEVELRKLSETSDVADLLSQHFIQSGAVVLIDALDTALREAFGGNNEAWKAGQLGLAKASYSLFAANPHVKVIASIRQEAWAGFEDEQKEVIGGKSIILEYTSSELRTIFENAIRQYSGKDTISDFLGVEYVHNRYLNEDEDPFLYILRHSDGSPRALMHFGKFLDNANLNGMDEDQRQRTIENTVDDVASVQIYEDYLRDQKSHFLKILRTTDMLRKLLKLVPSNVLTLRSLRSIHAVFCKRMKLGKKDSHPFCELFNIGLLGRVQLDIAAAGLTQYFRKSHEFDWKQEELLEDDTIYLLHPGLASAIVRTRRININRANVVGSDRPWVEKKGHDGIPKLFISYSSVDRSLVEKILKYLIPEVDLRFPSHIWFDKWSIRPGQHRHEELEKGVIGADIVILFASKSSLNSGWVDTEWRCKHEQEIATGKIRLIVVIVNETSFDELPEFLKMKLAVKINKSNMTYMARELADSICHYSEECLEDRLAALHGKPSR